ncbi:E3 ubiquitin-protein ligase SGR9, amyloplastic-like protein [Drosera capensis]
MDNYDHSTAAESVIFAALSTLTPTQLSILSLTLSTTFRRHSRRLATVLSSQTLFTTTLNHLLSLPLPSKSLLLARHLLSTLRLLIPFLHDQYHHCSAGSVTTVITSLRDLDAALLLLLFCELRHHSPWLLEHEKMHCWRKNVMVYFEDVMLTLSGIDASNEEVIRDFVDVVVTCLRFAGRSNKKEVPYYSTVNLLISSTLLKSSISGGSSRGGGETTRSGGGSGQLKRMRGMSGRDEGRQRGVYVAVRAHVPLVVRAAVVQDSEHMSLLPVQAAYRRCLRRDRTALGGAGSGREGRHRWGAI